MWKVQGYMAQNNDDSVVTANPMQEIKRFQFKDPEAEIEILYNGITRRVYSGGQIIEDYPTYPNKINTLEDWADALAYTSFIGERFDYVDALKGTTKKQRQRQLARKVKAVSVSVSAEHDKQSA